MDESVLIRRLQRREEEAFNELVLRYQVTIYNVCVRMLADHAEAEDLAQDVFVRAFLAIDGFRGESALGTWLYRIALNLCRNRIKWLGRRQYRASDPMEDVSEGAVVHSRGTGTTVGELPPRPDQVLEGNVAENRIQRALAAIDPDFRELLVLRDVEGLSYAEVVAITGLPEGTVKSRLHRARAALRAAYEELGGDA